MSEVSTCTICLSPFNTDYTTSFLGHNICIANDMRPELSAQIASLTAENLELQRQVKSLTWDDWDAWKDAANPQVDKTILIHNAVKILRGEINP